MISTWKNIERALYWLVLSITSLIALRPLVFLDVGDFKVYLYGSEQVFENKDLYNPGLGNFGKRYFNGPLLAWLHVPFTYIPESIALFSYRFIGIVCTCLVMLIVAGERVDRKKTALIIGLGLLMFASRMNVNLAQGAAVAALAGVVSIKILFKPVSSFNRTNYLISAFLFSIAFNYKPQLMLLSLIYIVLVAKKYRFLLFLATLNILYELIFSLVGHNATYLKWLQLLLARHNLIDDSGSQDVVGPFAFVVSELNLPVESVYFFLLLIVVSFFWNHGFRSNELNALWLLGLGTFIGPYSPAQDSLIFAALFLNWLIRRSEMRSSLSVIKGLNVVFISAILAAQALSTEVSFRNSLIIALCMALIMRELKLKTVNWIWFFAFTVFFSLIPQFIRTDHVTYDTVGFSTLLLAFAVTLTPNRRSYA